MGWRKRLASACASSARWLPLPPVCLGGNVLLKTVLVSEAESETARKSLLHDGYFTPV